MAYINSKLQQLLISIVLFVCLTNCKGQTNQVAPIDNRDKVPSQFWNAQFKKTFNKLNHTSQKRTEYRLAQIYGRTIEITTEDTTYNLLEELFTLDSIIAIYPKSLTPYRWKVQYLCREGKYDSAIITCTSYIKLHPDDFEFYNSRGDIYFLLGDKINSTNDFKKAKSILNYALDTIPKNADKKVNIYFQEAVVNILLGMEKNIAIDQFTQKVKLEEFNSKQVEIVSQLLNDFTIKRYLIQIKSGGFPNADESKESNN